MRVRRPVWLRTLGGRVPVRIDDIESDIELEGDSAPEAPAAAQPQPADPGGDVIERRSRDEERTRAWDFDD